MSSPIEWAHAFARQAAADFRAWQLYQKHPEALSADCHRLLLLQMACEKLCKAHLIRHGAEPLQLQTSHGYIAGPLPTIIREEIIHLREHVKTMGWVMQHVRHLASEIELLNPAVKRDGRRKDNCEYPWQDGPRIVSPLDYTFATSQLLVARAGRTFLKLLASAIQRNS